MWRSLTRIWLKCSVLFLVLLVFIVYLLKMGLQNPFKVVLFSAIVAVSLGNIFS